VFSVFFFLSPSFQEYLVVEVFQRQLGLFLTLLQFFGYATYAFLQRFLRGDLGRAIPLRYYVFLSILQVGYTPGFREWHCMPAALGWYSAVAVA
ncbi:unnamed protein product, partial [Discosporangium mesarthrocarpum]